MESQIAALLAQKFENESLQLPARSNSIRVTNNEIANEIT